MRWLAALLLVPGCEKDTAEHIHVQPAHVGDRAVLQLVGDRDGTADDGTVHKSRADLEIVAEVLAVDGPRMQRARVTFTRCDRMVDGQPLTKLDGPYEVTGSGAVHVDGTPMRSDETEFFTSWHIDVDPTTLGKHDFRVGDTFRPSAAELASLGDPDNTAFRVTRADSTAIVIDGYIDKPPRGDDPEERSHETYTFLADIGRDQTSDVVHVRDGKEVGHMHAIEHIRAQR